MAVGLKDLNSHRKKKGNTPTLKSKTKRPWEAFDHEGIRTVAANTAVLKAKQTTEKNEQISTLSLNINSKIKAHRELTLQAHKSKVILKNKPKSGLSGFIKFILHQS